MFLIYKEIQIGPFAKSYMRKRGNVKYLTIDKEAVSHIWLCNRSRLNFFIHEENLVFFFISVVQYPSALIIVVWIGFFGVAAVLFLGTVSITNPEKGFLNNTLIL